MKSFDDFKNLWLKHTDKIKSKKGFEHLVFIIVYPNKKAPPYVTLQWDFASEKQLQTTLLQTSGGVTGAGTGHDQKICYLTECNFRKIPPPRYPEDEFAAEPWYSIAPNDVFPEEFATFIFADNRVRQSFLKHHKDLLDADFWIQKQKNVKAGIFEDVFPYPQNIRFGFSDLSSKY